VVVEEGDVGGRLSVVASLLLLAAAGGAGDSVCRSEE